MKKLLLFLLILAISLYFLIASGDLEQYQPTVAPVPEPAIMLLLGVGFIAVVVMGRTKFIR